MTVLNTLKNGYVAFGRASEQWFASLAQLGLRLAAAQVFLSSGLSKWNGWFDFNEQKYDLFLYEFFCPDPVRPGALLLCDPDTLDYEPGSFTVTFVEWLTLTAGVMEIVLPALLIVGLFSRLAALGLIGMTLFIQLAVFPTWDHWWNPAVWWFVALFAVFARGPGSFSLDRWLKLGVG
ncbi:MAG: DoxX family protein [Cellvibrionaceae bacterium]